MTTCLSSQTNKTTRCWCWLTLAFSLLKLCVWLHTSRLAFTMPNYFKKGCRSVRWRHKEQEYGRKLGSLRRSSLEPSVWTCFQPLQRYSQHYSDRIIAADGFLSEVKTSDLCHDALNAVAELRFVLYFRWGGAEYEGNIVTWQTITFRFRSTYCSLQHHFIHSLHWLEPIQDDVQEI